MMPYSNNDPEHIKIRRAKDTLIIVGSGTIAFSLWLLVRTLVLLFELREETLAALRRTDPLADVSDSILFGAIAGVMIIVMLLGIAIRSYVGLSAIAEGRGKRRGPLYLLVAAVLIVTTAASVIRDVNLMAPYEEAGAFSDRPSPASFVSDLISLIMMIELVISSVRIREFRKKQDSAKGV